MSDGRSTNSRSICSSIVAVMSDVDSWLGSSGANAGSEPSEASAVCIRPITAPSSAIRATNASGSVPISSSASSQPSRPPLTKRCTTPSVASISSPE